MSETLDEFEAEKDKTRIEASRSLQVTIKLSEKIKLNGIEVDSITMRAPKANDMIEAQNMKASDGAMELALIAKLAGAPPAEVGELIVSDYMLCAAALEGFQSCRPSKRR